MKIWPPPDSHTKARNTRFAERLKFVQTAGHVLLRSANEFMEDDIMNVAAASTFYILLGFFPAVAAFVSFYGLFAKIENVRAHLSYLAGFLPNSVLQFVGNEMVRITETHPTNLSGAFFLSLAFWIWSA